MWYRAYAAVLFHVCLAVSEPRFRNEQLVGPPGSNTDTTKQRGKTTSSLNDAMADMNKSFKTLKYDVTSQMFSMKDQLLQHVLKMDRCESGLSQVDMAQLRLEWLRIESHHATQFNQTRRLISHMLSEHRNMSASIKTSQDLTRSKYHQIKRVLSKIERRLRALERGSKKHTSLATTSYSYETSTSAMTTENVTQQVTSKGDFTLSDLRGTIRQQNAELANLNSKLTSLGRQLRECNSSFQLERHTSNENITGRGFTKWMCNFEKDDCGFTFDTDASFGFINWTVGQTPDSVNFNFKTARRYPVGDKTYGIKLGHFAYSHCANPIRKSNYGRCIINENKAVGRFVSPVFQPSTSYCLTFSYNVFNDRYDHQYGYQYRNEKYSTKLHVKTKFADGPGVSYAKKSFTNSGKNIWYTGSLILDNEDIKRPFQVVFEVECGLTGSYGLKQRKQCALAIDDIQMTGPCTASRPSGSTWSRCPEGYVEGVNRTCYLFVTTPRIWHKAVDFCKQITPNAHLVALNESTVSTYVKTIIGDNPVLSEVDGWFTAGSDTNQERDWIWTNSPKQEKFSFTDWLDNQPSNTGGNQNCLLLERHGDILKWNDVDCQSKNAFICNIPW